MARLLIILGFLLILIGLLWPLIRKFGIGTLPGDILIRREGFTLYIPITSAVIVSLIISFIWWIMNR